MAPSLHVFGAYLPRSGGTLNGALVFGSGMAALTEIQGPPDQAFTVASTVPASASAATAGNALNLTASAATAGTASGSAVGGAIAITAGNAAGNALNAGATASAGGSITLTAGNAARGASGNANGGDINLVPGTGIGSGTTGVIAPSGQIAFPTGLGAITQIKGPSDQDLLIQGTTTKDVIIGTRLQSQVFNFRGQNLQVPSDSAFHWTGTNYSNGGGSSIYSPDAGIARSAAAVVKVTDGSTGGGDLQLPLTALTAGTLTATTSAYSRSVVHKYSWTNAMVVAAAGTANKIDICTLPAKTLVKRCWIVISTAADQAATLTVQAGTSADTDGFIVASNAKAAANTVYGDAKAERGVLLYDATTLLDYLPSYTATTLLQLEFVIGAGTLSDVTSSTGVVILETALLP